MKDRIPTRPVSRWPKKQLRSYAYDAIERDTFNDDREIQAEADAAFRRWFKQQMTRDELQTWACREVEWRMLNS